MLRKMAALTGCLEFDRGAAIGRAGDDQPGNDEEYLHAHPSEPCEGSQRIESGCFFEDAAEGGTRLGLGYRREGPHAKPGQRTASVP